MGGNSSKRSSSQGQLSRPSTRLSVHRYPINNLLLGFDKSDVNMIGLLKLAQIRFEFGRRPGRRARNGKSRRTE